MNNKIYYEDENPILKDHREILDNAIDVVKRKINYDGPEIEWKIFSYKYSGIQKILLKAADEVGYFKSPNKVCITPNALRKPTMQDSLNVLVKSSPLVKNDVDEALANVLLQAFAYAKAAETGELSYKEQLDKYTKLWFDALETAEKNMDAHVAQEGLNITNVLKGSDRRK